jgi:hypothetical protein
MYNMTNAPDTNGTMGAINVKAKEIKRKRQIEHL